MKTVTSLPLIALAATFSMLPLYAQVPQLITFQGKLSTAQTNPVTSALNMTFRVYDTNTGGASLWQETHTNTTVTRGVFAVPLGVNAPLTLPFDRPYWVSIQVSNDTEMLPRQQLNSSPYSLRAKTADTAVNASALGGYQISQLGFVPVGAMLAWSKNLPGVPALPDNFKECNGQVVNDAASPLNGVMLPDLNLANRFLRGNTTSGATGGVEQVVLTVDQLPSHSHVQRYQAVTGAQPGILYNTLPGGPLIPVVYPSVQFNGTYNNNDPLTTGNAGGNQPHENRPPFYDVVWIIRVR